MQMPPLENVRWQCLGIRAPRRAGPVAAGSPAANHNSAADRRAGSPTPRHILHALVAGLGLALSIGSARAEWDPVERSITDLEAAYTAGSTSVVEVVQTYLARIAQFDQPSTSTSMYPLNSVAQINPLALADAARIDSLRAQGATTSQYPLLGVPVLVKDSFDVAGLPTRVGLSILDGANTPGGTTLTALDDAASVARLRDAGAIILGKATMSSLAWSTGGIDNAFGLVRNPYNLNRLPGGSSSGSAVSVAANLAMLSMGGETGGSIRIPSTFNALVGLKTSLGLIDPEGTWPLRSGRDVVGPMAKTVADVAIAMNALVGPSPTNPYNNTPLYPTAAPGSMRPTDYTSGLTLTALEGKVLAVPRTMMVAAGDSGFAPEGTVNDVIVSQFSAAIAALRSRGATVIEVDVPATTTFYTTLGAATPTTVGFGYDYPTTQPGGTTPDNSWTIWATASYLNDQIIQYDDPVIRDLHEFNQWLQAGATAGTGSPLDRLGMFDSTSGTWSGVVGYIDELTHAYDAGLAAGFATSLDAQRGLQAYTSLRIDQFDGFLANPHLSDDPLTTDIDESTITHIDALVAPTYGRVMSLVPASERIPGIASGDYPGGSAYLLGRLEANILGAPAIAVPMGYFDDGTPLSLQFIGGFLQEQAILGLAYGYEQATHWRHAPNLDPFVPEIAPAGFGSVASLLMGMLGLVERRLRRRMPSTTDR